jgi:hypothetical protein
MRSIRSPLALLALLVAVTAPPVPASSPDATPSTLVLTNANVPAAPTLAPLVLELGAIDAEVQVITAVPDVSRAEAIGLVSLAPSVVVLQFAARPPNRDSSATTAHVLTNDTSSARMRWSTAQTRPPSSLDVAIHGTG